MSDAERPFSDKDDGVFDQVKRFEDMIQKNDNYFFDVEEFEMIIEHYLEENMLKKAQEVLSYAHTQHPASTNLFFCEAQIMLSIGKLNAALDVLEKIEKLEPFNEEVHIHKAGIYSQLRKHRKAIKHYRRALELARDAVDDIYLDLAFEYENCDEYTLALDCLQKALAINPENEAVLYEMAFCYDLAEDNEGCITFFERFLDDQPYSFVGWFSIGNAQSKLKMYEESNHSLDLCIAIDDRFSSAYFCKARNLLHMGQYENAIECYRETIDHEGPQAITFSYIGECLEKLEEYDQALIHYDQAIALDPTFTDAWIGRGVVKDLQGKVTESVKDLQQALKLSPGNGDALFFLGNVLGRCGRFEEAFQTYEKLNGYEPENMEGWLDHADLLLQMKGPVCALNKLKEAELIHKLNSNYRCRKVSYLLQAGQEQAALIELEEALALDPTCHTVLIEHYPEAARIPQVMHIITLHQK